MELCETRRRVLSCWDFRYSPMSEISAQCKKQTTHTTREPNEWRSSETADNMRQRARSLWRDALTVCANNMLKLRLAAQHFIFQNKKIKVSHPLHIFSCVCPPPPRSSAPQCCSGVWNSSSGQATRMRNGFYGVRELEKLSDRTKLHVVIRPFMPPWVSGQWIDTVEPEQCGEIDLLAFHTCSFLELSFFSLCCCCVVSKKEKNRPYNFSWRLFALSITFYVLECRNQFPA